MERARQDIPVLLVLLHNPVLLVNIVVVTGNAKYVNVDINARVVWIILSAVQDFTKILLNNLCVSSAKLANTSPTVLSPPA